MTAKETGWFRLEGGTVQEMDLPVHESIAQRVAKGEITRVVKVRKGDEERWEPWVEQESALPEVSDAQAKMNMAEVHAALSEALDRAAEVVAELDSVTAERDAAAAEVEQLRAAGVQLTEDLARVTAERDALADATTKAPAKATKAKADQ